jgi:hypothetical protein
MQSEENLNPETLQPSMSELHGAASAALARIDKTAPLAVALLQKGLSEQQIVQDNWTALVRLPQDTVSAIVAAPGALTEQDRTALERDATLDALKVEPSSPLSCEWWCRVLSRFAKSQQLLGAAVDLQLFGTIAVRDALVATASQVTTARASEWWCTAIYNLTFNDAGAQLFGTAAVRDALLAAQPRATTAIACRWWCNAVANLVVNDANRRLFGTAAMRDAFVALQPRATTVEACQLWCGAIADLNNMTHNNNAVNQELFGTAEVRDALVALSAQATTAEACRHWCSVIYRLTSSGANLQLLRVTAVREAHAALRNIAQTGAEARRSWSKAALALHDPPSDGKDSSASSTTPAWLSSLMNKHDIQLDDAAIAALVAHKIDGKVFLTLTKDDLPELGITAFADKRKVQMLVDAAKAIERDPSSPTSASAPAASSDIAAASLAEMTADDLATTQRFAARLPTKYRLRDTDLELGGHLAAGGMGTVMTARLRSTREQCVVKLNKDRNPNAVRRFLREIYISLSVQHRFIARPLGVAFATGGVQGIEALLVLERGVCSLEDFVAAKRQQRRCCPALRT